MEKEAADMRENYGILFEKTREEVRRSGTRPRLLLHACCAPCSSHCLEEVARDFDVTIFFYNPNIAPEEEFRFREGELARFLDEAGYRGISIDVPPYDPAPFYELARGLEHVPEGGARCYKCYELRLRETAKAARAGGFDWFTTTLSISPYKNAAWLNEIGIREGEAAGVPYLCSDFKKKNGYRRSIELSKEYHLYRQDYCGCEFSRAERDEKLRRAAEEQIIQNESE